MARPKKEIKQQPKAKKLVQYQFRADRVALKEKEGWRRVKGAVNPLHPRTHLEDLVLMEKNV